MKKPHRLFFAWLWVMLAVHVGAAPSPGEKRVWPMPDWTTVAPESQGVSAAKLEALRAYFEAHKTRAALVVRHGRIVGEWYWEGQSQDSKFAAFSVTKSLSSTAIGLLVKDKKVKIDQSASDFIPEWRSDDRKTVTVRHLLCMDSGILKKEPDLFMQKDQLTFAIAQPLQKPAGTFWDYNNVACNTLSQVITKASGEEMADFLQRRLYDPLGMKNVSMDKSSGKTLAYMGLQVSARELAKVGYLFLNKGVWNGKRLLDESWIKMATTASQELNKSYGFLWWVRTYTDQKDLPKDSYNAIGLFGNYLSVFPSQDLIVVRLVGNKGGADVNGDEFARLALAAIEK